VFFYSAAALNAAREQVSLEAAQVAMGYQNDSVYFAIHPEQRAWSPSARYLFMGEEGSRELRHDPLRYVPIHAAGVGRLLFRPGAIDFLRLYHLEPPGLLGQISKKGLFRGTRDLFATGAIGLVLFVALGALLLVAYGLAVRGVVSKKGLNDSAMIVLLCGMAYFVLIGGGPVGGSRFRHPIMPFICVLAAAGFDSARRREPQSPPTFHSVRDATWC